MAIYCFANLVWIFPGLSRAGSGVEVWFERVDSTPLTAPRRNSLRGMAKNKQPCNHLKSKHTKWIRLTDHITFSSCRRVTTRVSRWTNLVQTALQSWQSQKKTNNVYSGFATACGSRPGIFRCSLGQLFLSFTFATSSVCLTKPLRRRIQTNMNLKNSSLASRCFTGLSNSSNFS